MARSLPNVLTALRLAAIPVLAWAMIADDGAMGELRWLAVGLFAFAAVTDYADGAIARRYGWVTAFGKLADPIADKALVLGTLALLVWTDGVPWWTLAVLALREIGVTFGRLAVADKVVIPAGRIGKVKTTVQLVALGLYLLPVGGAGLDAVAFWLLVAAVVTAAVSGVQLAFAIARAARLERKARRAGGQGDDAGADDPGAVAKPGGGRAVD